MRRIIAVLCVMALMAAMVVVMAMPAFAKEQCGMEGTTFMCRGGSGSGGGGSGGGSGGLFILNYQTGDIFLSGGGGNMFQGPERGGYGGHCSGNFNNSFDCSGGGSS